MSKLLDQYAHRAMQPIETAQCLPLAVYHDQEIFKLEQQAIFENEWVFICSTHELANTSDYLAFTMANEPIAIIRGEDGQLRALSNVCRHRGTPLLDEGFGQISKNIICPYHAWTFTDQGKLKAVPFAGKTDDGKPAIDKEKHCLPEFHLQEYMGLVFINLSDEPHTALTEQLDGLEDYLSIFNIDAFTTGIRGANEHWNANWKLILENAMESYHLFKVHEQTLELGTPTRDAYYLAGSSEWTITGGKIKGVGESKLMNWLTGPYPEAFNHYILVSLPPSFVGILTYESFDWLQVLPVDSEHSIVRSGGISTTDKGHKQKSIMEFTKQFFEEDKEICERVQTAMKSRRGKGGKLVNMERVVTDFHQFLGSRLFNQEPSEFHINKDMIHLLEDDE